MSEPLFSALTPDVVGKVEVRIAHLEGQADELEAQMRKVNRESLRLRQQIDAYRRWLRIDAELKDVFQ